MAQQLALSVDFGSGFTDAWSKIAKFIPQFIAFLAILVIGWIVAKAIAKVLDRVLRKVGSERVAERAGMARHLSGSNYDMTGIICKIVYYAILLMVLQLAFGVFGPNPISVMIHSIVAWLPRGIVAVAIVVVAMAIANGVRDIVRNALAGASYGRTVATIAWAFIVALGVIAALGQAGIATAITGPVLIAALATIAGVLVVGVGGGLILPMRQRWERWLDHAEQESAKLRGSAYQAGRADVLANQPARPTTQAAPGTTPPPPGIDPGRPGDRPS
ncbi:MULTISPECIES: mechanosensitive ion channel family protein [unclassified Kitasatospora]|uniref:mechanosensitive ion channel family protein n=1 Tax=unclassified Kitasatospora TaxID=2633591 RepID=UPI0034239215